MGESCTLARNRRSERDREIETASSTLKKSRFPGGENGQAKTFLEEKGKCKGG